MVDGNSVQRLAKTVAATLCVVLLVFLQLVSSKPLARKLLLQTAHIPNLESCCPTGVAEVIR